MYKVIIFDFFGVFCSSIASDWFKKNVPDYGAKLTAFHALCTQSDYGKLPRNDFNKEVSKLTSVPASEIAKGIEAETKINNSLVEYAQNLKSTGYRVACLSNGTQEWTLQVINNHGLGELFEQIILSGDLGIVKPSSEIYIHTLKKLKIPAAEVIFVDDRKTNTDAAEKLGIRSLVFTDTPSFIAEFETLVGGK